MSGPSAGSEERNIPERSVKPSLEEKVHKVLVGIPLKGHTPPASYHDRMLMWKHMGAQEAIDFYEKKSLRYSFSLGAIGEMLISYARERLAAGAVEMGCEYLFMVDDDMLAPPDLFYKLAANDKDICAALAFTRNPDHKPVVYETFEGRDNAVGADYGLTQFVQNYPRNKLFQCDAVGFGAVLIKTKVIKAILGSKQSCFFGMERTGEDIAFCIKARKLGFQVWMDSRIKLGHLGAPTIITEDYSDQWNGLTSEQREKLYGQFTKYETGDMV